MLTYCFPVRPAGRVAAVGGTGAGEAGPLHLAPDPGPGALAGLAGAAAGRAAAAPALRPAGPQQPVLGYRAREEERRGVDTCSASCCCCCWTPWDRSRAARARPDSGVRPRVPSTPFTSPASSSSSSAVFCVTTGVSALAWLSSKLRSRDGAARLHTDLRKYLSAIFIRPC